MLWLASVAFAAEITRTVPIDGDARTVPITQVVIHATGGPSCDPRSSFKGGTLDGMVELFRTRTDGVSIHYIIGEDGNIVAMVPEDRVASHAKGHNANSIGIELVNDGDGVDPFPAAQVQAVTGLVVDILKRNHLGAGALVTHDSIDTRTFECDGQQQKTKVDPGPAFPWDSFTADVKARVGG